MKRSFFLWKVAWIPKLLFLSLANVQFRAETHEVCGSFFLAGCDSPRLPFQQTFSRREAGDINSNNENEKEEENLGLLVIIWVCVWSCVYVGGVCVLACGVFLYVYLCMYACARKILRAKATKGHYRRFRRLFFGVYRCKTTKIYIQTRSFYQRSGGTS